MYGNLVAINRCGPGNPDVNFSMFIRANLILVQFNHIRDDLCLLNRRCYGIVVNHNQNTKYLKNSNPKYFIGSCLKK